MQAPVQYKKGIIILIETGGFLPQCMHAKGIFVLHGLEQRHPRLWGEKKASIVGLTVKES
jgi:hypothetical protein